MNRQTSLRRTGPIRRRHTNDVSLPTLWENFSAKYAADVRRTSADGLIACQATQHESSCPGRLERPDLHHLFGKLDRPDLYFSKPNLIWLYRDCHDKIHRNDTRPAIQQSQQPALGDPARPSTVHQVRESLGVRGGSTAPAQAKVGSARTIYSTRRSRDDHILSRQTTRPRSLFNSRHNAESQSV